MSNYYLCSGCERCLALRVWEGEVECAVLPSYKRVRMAAVMYDGGPGVGYERELDVCPDYRRRASVATDAYETIGRD